MAKVRWRKDVTPDGVVTHTDPSGRLVIEKHTHHYGPWLIKDLELDERVGETEVSEAEAKRVAEDYLGRPGVRPVPPEPVVGPSGGSGEAAEFTAAVRLLATRLRLLADEVAAQAEPLARAHLDPHHPHADAVDAILAACARAGQTRAALQLAALGARADLAAARDPRR